MTFETLSDKQKKVFTWWQGSEKALICDGAVRSGKTICMITSYILWAMHNFNYCNFGICGKTVASAERNIIRPLQTIIDITHYFKLSYNRSSHLLTIKGNGKENYFFVFGGKDESSYALLQGITLSGIFLDEVALMPESFVNQAIARTLSEKQSRYWFNCNPESPAHWFYNQWILDAENKNALHLHFLMSDNPTLDEKQLQEAEKQFTGVFYQRYIKGEWVLAEGLIYPMYKEALQEPPQGQAERYVLSIDYGTLNAFAAMLWGKYGGVWYAIDGYYYSGRDEGTLKTDEEYAQILIDKFAQYGNEYYKLKTIVDPSAASFITALRQKHIFGVMQANNAVVDGIRNTATALQLGLIKIDPQLDFWVKEAAGYIWDDTEGQDRPVKVNDHCLTGDTIVNTVNGDIPIKYLVGASGEVWSYDGEKKIAKSFKDVRLTQRDVDIYKITVADGREIKCTGEHLILTENGWKKANALCENDKIIQVDV